MSISRVHQVILIILGALEDVTGNPVDLKKIGGAIDILTMLEEKLAAQVNGGDMSA